MKDIISQIFHECNKFVRLVMPVVHYLIYFGIYIFCFCTYFFKPLLDSINKKHQKEAIDKKQFNISKQEYETLLEDIQLVKQDKKKYQKQVKTLRQEISWSRDRLLLEKWGKDGTSLDEYRKKLEDEWNQVLDDEDDD